MRSHHVELAPGALRIARARERACKCLVDEREVEVGKAEGLGFGDRPSRMVERRLGPADERVDPAAQVVAAHLVHRRPHLPPVVLRGMGHVDHRLGLRLGAILPLEQVVGAVVALDAE